MFTIGYSIFILGFSSVTLGFTVGILGCSYIDCSIKICAICLSAIIFGWEGSNLYAFDLSACNKSYAAMTYTLVGGICGGS